MALPAFGDLYAIAGQAGPTAVSSKVEVYHPATDTWSAAPDLPTGVTGAAGVVLASQEFEQPDFAYGLWTSAAPLPLGLSATAVASDGDYAYVMTGYNYSNLNLRYNLRSNSWTTLAPLPASFGAASATYYNGRIYLAGGFDGNPRNSLYAYDISNDSWSTLASLPSGRPDLALLAIGDRLYAFGGTRGAESSYLIYDIANDSWSSQIPLPQHRAFVNGVVVDGEAYLVGGVDADSNGSAVSSVERFTASNQSFSALATLPYPTVMGPFVAAVGRSIYVIGGQEVVGSTAGGRTDFVQVFDLDSGKWSFGPRLPVMRSYGRAVAVGSVVLCVGGEKGGWPMPDVSLLSTSQLSTASGSSDQNLSLLFTRPSLAQSALEGVR